MQREKWIRKKDRADILKLSKELNLPPYIIKILTNRGHLNKNSIIDFLENREGELNDPSLLPDVDLAFDILMEARENNFKVRIVGDYDADGVMSTAILYLGLKRLGINTSYRLPDRFKDGYGLSKNIVIEAQRDGIDLIITCDNGISSYKEIELANSLNIKVIITDHHDIPKEGDIEIIPPADAIINPKLQGSPYPFTELCGAGIAYQFLAFVYRELGLYDETFEELLQFAAIATICDIMPLYGDNRKIVYRGLRLLNETKHEGLKTLIKKLGYEDKRIDEEAIGFRIGPVINAAGRIASPETALRLMIGEGDQGEIVEELIRLNNQRKSETEKGSRRAITHIDENHKDDSIIVCYIEDLHEGVAGNIAGRLTERYHRPVLLITDSQDFAKASGRSVDSFHITQALSPHRDLFMTFGGHGGACGFSLEKENIPILRSRLLSDYSLEDIDPSKIYDVDYKMSLEILDMNVMKLLNLVAPYGEGNREPILTDLKVKTRKISILGKNKNVVRFDFLTIHNKEVVGILFSRVEEFLDMVREHRGEEYLMGLTLGNKDPLLLDILYSPQINQFNGRTNIQAKIISFRIAK